MMFFVVRQCCKLLEVKATTTTPTHYKFYNSLSSKRSQLLCSKWSNVRNYRPRKKEPLVPETIKPPEINEPLTFKTLIKPFLFTVGFSGAAFAGCTISEYERLRQTAKEHWKKKNWLEGSPFEKRPQWRKQLNDFWNSLTEGQKVFAPVLFFNLLVFAAWRVPRFQPAMVTYFASNPAAKVICWPMLLSAFSHYSFFHLAANMFVLHSFSDGVVRTLGKEQAVLLYLSAGVISSFTSFVYKVIVSKPGLSVGASGAIMAFLGFVCTQYPDAQLSFILLPMYTFSAGTAIKVAVGVDMMGCLLGWRFFDHAAHLGGALTGILWAYYGNQYVWQQRGTLMKKWNDLRGGWTG